MSKLTQNLSSKIVNTFLLISIFSTSVLTLPISDLVYFKVVGTDSIKVLPGKQAADDIFHNFVLSSPSEDIYDFIVPSGVGTFMNISYANLFLRVSIDHSFVFLVSDFCQNCDKNILLNVSHSLTGDIYNFESNECWSNSFVTNQYKVPQCEVKLNYGTSNLMGILGYDTIYLTAYAKSFPLPNIVYLTSQDDDLIDSDINGLFGLGTPDMDGSYGISLLEELLNNNVMETPLFSLCTEPIGKGYLFLSAYGNGSFPFDQSSIVWFEQTYSYMYTVDMNKIAFHGSEYKLQEKHVQFTLNIPYLLLDKDTFEGFVKDLTDFLCNNGAEFAKLCDNIQLLMHEEGSITMRVSEAAILKKIPTLDLHLKGKGNKQINISIQKIFAVCPSRSKEYFLATADNEISVCSMIQVNKYNPKRIVLGNIAHTGQGNLYIFDKRRGLLGISQEVTCYPKPTSQNMVILKLPMTYSLIGQIFIILGFCTLLVLSLNKCDEYFYQEEDPEGEEGVSLNFLTHNQTRSDITDHNATHNLTQSHIR